MALVSEEDMALEVEWPLEEAASASEVGEVSEEEPAALEVAVRPA